MAPRGGQSRSGVPSPGRRWLRDLRPSWFAAIPPKGLASEGCQTEQPFYDRLGFAVLMTASVSSLALLVSLGYVLHKPATVIWPVAVFWFVVILNLDMLLQAIVATKHMWIAAIPRILVSLVLGVLISEPLLLVINGSEINRALVAQTQVEIQQEARSIESFYQPQIAKDEATLVGIQRQVGALRAVTVQDTYIANCEAGDPRCSLTHRAGCGPVCLRYRQLAQVARTQLAAERPLDFETVSRIQSDLRVLTGEERQALDVSRGSTLTGNGFIAREEVLAHLMATSTPVLYECWLLRSAFWLLDLLPLLLAYVHVSLGSSAYALVLAARRRHEALRAHAIDVATKVERARIDDQCDADIESNRASIWAEQVRRARQSEHAYAGERPSNDFWDAAPIPAVSLSDVGPWVPHESMSISVPPALRRAAQLGTAITASTAIVVSLLSWALHVQISGVAFADLALVGAVVLGIRTRGFTQANRWQTYATFATFVGGLAIPLLVMFMNL